MRFRTDRSSEPGLSFLLSSRSHRKVSCGIPAALSLSISWPTQLQPLSYKLRPRSPLYQTLSAKHSTDYVKKKVDERMENRLPDKRNSAGKWFDRPPISRHYIFPSILSLQQPPTHARPARHTLDAVKLAMQGDPRQSQVTVTTHSESSPRAVPPRPIHSRDMNLAHAAIPRSRHQPAPLS